MDSTSGHGDDSGRLSLGNRAMPPASRSVDSRITTRHVNVKKASVPLPRVIATPIILLIVLISAAGFVRLRAAVAADPRNQDAKIGQRIAAVGFALPLLIWLLISAFSMFHSVPSGEVGVVKQFGRVTGHTSSGFVLTTPWRTITTVNTKTQNYKPTTPLTAFTKETQDVDVLVQINYHVDREFAQTLVANVGDDFVNVILIPKIPTIVKEEVVKYAAVDVAP